MWKVRGRDRPRCLVHPEPVGMVSEIERQRSDGGERWLCAVLRGEERRPPRALARDGRRETRVRLHALDVMVRVWDSGCSV